MMTKGAGANPAEWTERDTMLRGMTAMDRLGSR